MELKEARYANEVTTIAQDLMGSHFSKNNYVALSPFVAQYLPYVRNGLKQANRRCDDGGSYAHIAMGELMRHVNPRIDYATDYVPRTVAYTILTKDPALSRTSDHDLRFFFDLSLGVPVDDYHRRYEGVLRDLAYEVSDGSRREELLDWAEIWRQTEIYYASFQKKLREPISITRKGYRR